MDDINHEHEIDIDEILDEGYAELGDIIVFTKKNPFNARLIRIKTDNGYEYKEIYGRSTKAIKLRKFGIELSGIKILFFVELLKSYVANRLETGKIYKIDDEIVATTKKNSGMLHIYNIEYIGEYDVNCKFDKLYASYYASCIQTILRTLPLVPGREETLIH